MSTKQQKRAVIRQLLVPILLIVAALLYQPLRSVFVTQTDTTDTKPVDQDLQVIYIDVGQGDATLIEKGNFHMLIDAGKNEKGSTVVQYLKKEGIEKLDVLVGTHPDSDHIGGLDTVLEEIPADVVYMPKATKETKTYREVEEVLQKKGQEAQMPEIGKTYTYDGNVVCRFLSPSKTYTDANNNSLVLQLAYGKNRFLFMGDAEEEAEKDIVSQFGDLSCDVLKAGHHGSYTASSETLLKAADPVYAVISCGRDNSYGHPHAEVLSRLEDEDVQIYRTDTMGTVKAVSDGENVTMSTENG